MDRRLPGAAHHRDEPRHCKEIDVINHGQLILFQGDSITDTGRNRESTGNGDPFNLGVGYAGKVASRLMAERPGDDLRFINRGISGHRIVDLYARWKTDAINLNPDLISILVGVNDTWHHFTRDNGVEVDRYEQVYRMLLEWTRQRLPHVKLVLCEPFILPCGVGKPNWREEIDQRRAVVAQLADDFDARLVPFQAMFDQALDDAPAEYWAADGVHPTAAGHQRMADLWLSTVTAPAAG